ncbi:MAG: hypothetical protein HY652_09965 [Acidobacteria bacterium]|nr:hypothetical protein [Acidobacteriota bacterium]
MSKREAIEEQIRSLTREDRAALRRWFLEFDAEAWDQEIEADVEAGKLDGLADAALEAHRAGKTTPL